MSALSHPVAPLPASTVLLLRQRAGLEVFMARRNDALDFGPGALVFPGGKVDLGDCDPSLRALSGVTDGVSDVELAYRAAAIREVFEECGILLARDEAGVMVCGKRLQSLARYRTLLERDELPLAAFLRDERLTLASDGLAYCAHWITPSRNPKRFDTHFFLAAAPDDHDAEHCGREAVESLWTTPSDVLRQAEEGKWFLMPPTEVNLRLLARSETVEAALALARSESIPSVLDGVDPRFPDVANRWAHKGRPTGAARKP
ncbi:MAG: NUDIX hydrolase [Caulobacterales bacterium]